MLSKKKITVFTNIFICVLIMIVFLVSFLPAGAVAISGKENYAPIYNGDKNSDKVALMFNVYENTEIVNGILDVLKNYNVKATFFVGGCWADDNAETLVRILSEGHEIGNHGYFHKNHKKLSEADNIAEIVNCGKIVTALTGYEMKLFAPPSGAFNETTLSSAMKLGYKTIMWSRDTIDWKYKNENTVFKRATEKTVGGDLILMHPKEHTLKALDKILDCLKNKKLRAVTVSECIGETLI